MKFKKQAIMFLAVSAMAFGCKKDSGQLQTTDAEVKANWSSSDKFANYDDGEYYINNDVWGGGAGPQSIWANSHADWGIYSQQSGGGIKSYAHVGKPINQTIHSFTTIKSTWKVAANPAVGAYDTSYDIWLNDHNFEIMLWTYEIGSIKPISDHYNGSGAVPYYTNVNVGGHIWNVYAGPHGNGSRTFSFVRTTTSNGGTVDLLAIFKYIEGISKTNSAFAGFNNPTLQDVQFGWEITNTNGVGTSFHCNDFSVTNY